MSPFLLIISFLLIWIGTDVNMLKTSDQDPEHITNLFLTPTKDVLSNNVISSGGQLIIEDAAAPVIFNGHYYYWDHTYFNINHNDLKKCIIEINSTNDAYLNESGTLPPSAESEMNYDVIAQAFVHLVPARDVELVFINGTKPEVIVFGCGTLEFCNDFECSSIPLDVLKCSAVILILAAVLGYTFFRVKKKQIISASECESMARLHWTCEPQHLFHSFCSLAIVMQDVLKFSNTSSHLVDGLPQGRLASLGIYSSVLLVHPSSILVKM
ncbi:hypothetical protein RB195_011362 [Necator americanus]|uniref:CX domain-containing protein n=1 Tax=Necator americanus TaxID=51031 RepID=A0ABR1D271_NECAM